MTTLQPDWAITRQESSDTNVHWRVESNMIQLCSSDAKFYNFAPVDEPNGAAMIAHGPDLFRSLHVPTSVLCAIVVFAKEDIHLRLKPEYVDWRDVDAFKGLSSVMEEHMNDALGCDNSRAQRCVYRKTGRVRLMQLNGKCYEEVCARVVDKDAHWRRHVPKMVAEYCGQDHNRPFMLEVRLEYDWFEIAENYDRFSDSILNTLGNTIAHNFDEEPYWPKKLINKLFSKHVVTRLVEEDRSWKKDLDDTTISDQQGKFVEYILADRKRLLGATIYSKVDLSFLYRMSKCKCGDPDKHLCNSHDNNIPLSRSLLKEFLDNRDSSTFYRFQNSFRPWIFPSNRTSIHKHPALAKDIVVPILYDDGRNHKENFKDSKDYIGDGAFGVVFSVSIHGDSHEFSSNKDEKFALKRLHIDRQSTNEAERESDVLHKIALLPHPHITPFYASWTQNRQPYILFPKADSNLSNWLRDTRPPFDLDQANVEWILEQLEGLAKGVAHIHNVGRVGLGSQQAELDKLHAGYHHDLKPANILIFGRVWKISDFGAAKIQQLISGTSNAHTPYTKRVPDGDAVYGGPDHTVSDYVGPLYDIWSLGCIFLEILLWLSLDTNEGVDSKSVSQTSELLELNLESNVSHESIHPLDKFANDRAQEPAAECKCPPKESQEEPTAHRPREHLEDEELRWGNAPEVQSTESPKFWYQCVHKNCHLKDAVISRMKKIKDFCEKESIIFRKLYLVVKEMLFIQPGDRPTASVVVDKIGSLRVHARVNFHRVRRTSISSYTPTDATSRYATDADDASQQGDTDHTDNRENPHRGRTQQHLSLPSPARGPSKKRGRSTSRASSNVLSTSMPALEDELLYTGAKIQEDFDNHEEEHSVKHQRVTSHGPEHERHLRQRPSIEISDYDRSQMDLSGALWSEPDVLNGYSPTISFTPSSSPKLNQDAL